MRLPVSLAAVYGRSLDTSAAPRILGIDPAPKKGLTVFEPKDANPFCVVLPSEARPWMERQRILADESHPVLVGWDAPLIVDFDLMRSEVGSVKSESRYTSRPIERAFSGSASCAYSAHGHDFGQGVNALAYSRVPHWAISLDVLGYPIPDWISPTQEVRLPLFRTPAPIPGSAVFETHPAVALALLLEDQNQSDPDSCRLVKYKGRPDIVADIAATAEFSGWMYDLGETAWVASTDDEMDALISYLCVKAFSLDKGLILGDETGGFLVPKNNLALDLQEHFKDVRQIGCDCRTCRP
jgi:hypothetical protein